jgi:hypothetical protein
VPLGWRRCEFGQRVMRRLQSPCQPRGEQDAIQILDPRPAVDYRDRWSCYGLVARPSPANGPTAREAAKSAGDRPALQSTRAADLHRTASERSRLRRRAAIRPKVEGYARRRQIAGRTTGLTGRPTCWRRAKDSDNVRNDTERRNRRHRPLSPIQGRNTGGQDQDSRQRRRIPRIKTAGVRRSEYRRR